MKFYFTLLVFTITIFKASSQTGFSKTYTGCAPVGIIVNSFENGFVTCNSQGIMKIDSAGNVVWTKSVNFGINCIAQTMDSCFIIGGSSSNTQVVCMKFDFNGDTIWSKAISVSQGTGISSLIETSDSSILITGIIGDTSGATTFKMIVMKLDRTGTLVWIKTFWTANNGNNLYGIKEGPDHNYYAWGYIGYHTSIFYYNAVLLCLSPAGNILWNRTYTDSVNAYITLLDIAFVDSGILLYLNIGQFATLTKTDVSGIPLWSKQYSFDSGKSYFPGSKNIFKLTDNDYFLSSGTSAAIVEVDSMGEIIKSYRTIWGFTCESFTLTSDSQFAFIGIGFSGPGIVRYDSLSDTTCVFISPESYIEDTLLTDSVVYTFGTDGTPSNYSTLLTNCTTNLFNTCPDFEDVEEISRGESITTFPNPTTGSLFLEFKYQSTPAKIDCIDLSGRLIKSYGNFSSSPNSINLAGIAEGIYLVKFYFDRFDVVKAICIQY